MFSLLLIFSSDEEASLLFCASMLEVNWLVLDEELRSSLEVLLEDELLEEQSVLLVSASLLLVEVEGPAGKVEDPAGNGDMDGPAGRGVVGGLQLGHMGIRC